MRSSSFRTLLAAVPLCALSALLTLPANAIAQQPWPSDQGQQRSRTRAPAPEPLISAEDELSPRQMQPPPAAQPDAPRARSVQAAPRAETTANATAPASAPSRPAQATPRGAPRSIICNGVFGRDSNHLKLAMAFEARNLTFTQVDGPDSTKLNASVVFPNDPKRRIEVIWNNDATRSGTSLVVIGGQSQWAAPNGLRIGMPLAALEKANGKPFKLSGLDELNSGSVLDWNGGALDSLPGGCKVGIRLAAEAKSNDSARAGAGGNELVSNDAALKTAKLRVIEIILGY